MALKRLTIWGSLIGGLKETQEMLEFCGENNVTCDIERIEATPTTIQTAFERISKSDVKYRFVLDLRNSFK